MDAITGAIRETERGAWGRVRWSGEDDPTTTTAAMGTKREEREKERGTERERNSACLGALT